MDKYGKRNVSDQELIERFIAGDSVSFTALFDRYLPLINKYHNLYGFDTMDFDDWRQEARIVLLKSVRYYECKKGVSFGSYLKANIKNKAFDVIRMENALKRVTKGQRISIHQEAVSESLVDYKNSAPDECAVCNESIREFLAICSPFEVEVFQLVQAGHNVEHIAEKLNCSVRKVKSALTRCHQKFQRMIV